MIGYILTVVQKINIQGKEFAPYQCFNCVLDINDIWYTFLTVDQEDLILNTEYSWVLGCPEKEYIPPIPPPFPPVV